MQRLRAVLASFENAGPGMRDREVLGRLSWLFASGRLHICEARLEHTPPPPAAEAEAPAFPLGQSNRPAPERRLETENVTLPPDADLPALAMTLAAAAGNGAAVCPI